MEVRDGTGTFVTEPEAFSDDQAFEWKIAQEDLPDKGFGFHPSEVRGERGYDEKVDPEFGQNLFFMGNGHDALEGDFRRKDHQGMGIEGEYGRKTSRLTGLFDQVRQKFLVTAVETVKIPDRQTDPLTGLPETVQFGERGKNVHRLAGCPGNGRGGMVADYSALANSRAARTAKYVRIMVAPARRMERRDSIIARSVSIHPSFPAAMIVAYSPLT